MIALAGLKKILSWLWLSDSEQRKTVFAYLEYDTVDYVVAK